MHCTGEAGENAVGKMLALHAANLVPSLLLPHPHCIGVGSSCLPLLLWTLRFLFHGSLAATLLASTDYLTQISPGSLTVRVSDAMLKHKSFSCALHVPLELSPTLCLPGWLDLCLSPL